MSDVIRFANQIKTDRTYDDMVICFGCANADDVFMGETRVGMSRESFLKIADAMTLIAAEWRDEVVHIENVLEEIRAANAIPSDDEPEPTLPTE